MSIEGDILANSFANTTARDAHQRSLTTRDDFIHQPLDVPDVSMEPLSQVDNAKMAEVKGVEHPMTPGDEILNTIQKISDAHRSTISALSEVTKKLKSKDNVSMADALSLQVGVMEFQLKNELIAKAANSVSNGVQTLFRNQ